MRPTPKAGNLVAGALFMAPVERDGTDIAILEATLRCLTRFGLNRMTVEDVAKAAGVGRATVFRRFESKDEMIRQAFALELRRLVEEFGAKADAIHDPYDRMVELSVETVAVIRTHPVARRLVEDGDALSLHRDPRIAEFQLLSLKSQLDGIARRTGSQADTAIVAELLMRFFGSVWLAPEISPAVDDPAKVRRMITTLLAPLAPDRAP